MKKFFQVRSLILLLIFILTFVFPFSCLKVSGLSDNNTITTVTVADEKPEEVVFDSPRIEDNKIIIPLRFGKYLFPIKAKLEIKTENSIDKILGFGSDGFLSFESISSIKEISVVAESGMTSKYEIVLEEVQSYDFTEIEQFTVASFLPQEAYFIDEAVIDEPSSTVTIYTISTSVPFTVIPKITLSPGAGFKDYKVNDPIIFESLTSNKILKIVSESGKEQIWNLILSPATLLTDNNLSEIPSDVLQRLSFESKWIKAVSQSAGVIIDTLLVSNQNSSITIFADNQLNKQEGTVKIEFVTDKYASLSGLKSGETISFKTWNETRHFFLSDKITGWTKEWTIEWRSTSNYAKLLNINKNGYSSTDGKIIIDNFIINQAERTVFIPVLENGIFPLVLNGCLTTLSPGAKTDLPSILSFSSINDIIEFYLDKDGLSERWSIVLTDNFTPKSNENEITGFLSGFPAGGYKFSSKYLESSKSQITLTVDNYNDIQKIKISPIIGVSAKAKLEGIVSGATIVLTPEEEYKFSVIAQDGSTREWKIKLIISPQVPNSNFETWGAHPQFSTIPLTISPSDGSGWNSSNNPSVQGLSRVAGYNSLYAAKLETKLSTINFANIIRVTSLASGSIFLGKFKYSILTQDVYHPQNMTKFGISYTGKSIPIAFSINFKYTKGANLVRTTPKFTSLNLPDFENPVSVEGGDKAIIWVELWHHSGTDAFDIQKEPIENKIARGEFILSDNVPDWSSTLVGITPLSGAQNLLPTHIVVTMSSSKEGDLFTGADGSTLIVDNFYLTYYIPGPGAKLLN